jgi:hypothetical protein
MAARQFTRIVPNRKTAGGVDYVWAELEAQADGKTFNISGKEIRLFLQIKDGDMREIGRAVTDNTGTIRYQFERKSLSPNTYLVYRFAGDAQFQESQIRVHVK